MRWAGVITICKVHLLLLIDEMCMLICLNQDYSKMGLRGPKSKLKARGQLLSPEQQYSFI